MTIYTTSLAAQITLTTFFCFLVLVGVAGNTLSCLVIITNRAMRTPMNYLILNLAMADIMVVLFTAPRFILAHAFNHPDGLLGSFVCKLFTGGNFSWLGGSASVFSLVAISVERYFAVIHPYGTRGKLTMKKVKYVIAGCWLLAVVFNLPLFIFIDYNKNIDFCTEFWPTTWMARAYSTAWLVLFGALPIILMSALYIRVIRRLWFKSQQGPRATQAAIVKSRKRVTKMVIMVSKFKSPPALPITPKKRRRRNCCKGFWGRSRIFFGGGALVSCATSTPINHIVFFCRIPVVLKNHRSSQGGGGNAHPLHPPPRSAPAAALLRFS